MTPKEKAIELHDKYYQIFENLGIDSLPNNYAKQCVLICVDEILWTVTSASDSRYKYYKEVKQEIEKL
jgi:hypothetical protein